MRMNILKNMYKYPKKNNNSYFVSYTIEVFVAQWHKIVTVHDGCGFDANSEE